MVDPENVVTQNNLCYVNNMLRLYDEAISAYRARG